MSKYNVKMPVAGYVLIEVEADNEKEAINNAASFSWDMSDVEDLEAYPKLMEGSICFPPHNIATAEKSENDEE